MKGARPVVIEDLLDGTQTGLPAVDLVEDPDVMARATSRCKIRRFAHVWRRS
jgi:hypothetical protein